MRAIVCIFAALLISLNASVQAATSLDGQTLQSLVQLEKKYFGHSFDTNSDDVRAQRLEKLVFGEPGSGDPKPRIEKLLAASAAAPGTPAASSTDQGASTAPVTKQSNTQSIRQGGSPASALDQSVPVSTSAPADNYPHVTALENAILGQSYIGQPLVGRLKRMETKAFGSPLDTPDLSQRTDLLDQYADKHLHKQVSPPNPAAETAETSDFQPEQNQAEYPHITALEKAILGQSFSGQPLVDRLSRMETKAFGSPSTSQDLSQRTDLLDQYADKQLHKGIVQTNSAAETTVSSDSQPEQNQSDYPHITELEKLILGQTFAGQALADRIGRMETKAFGSVSTNQDLSQRTDNLEKYAEKKLHKKPIDQDSTQTATANQQHGGFAQQALMSMVGNALLGMTGAGRMGFGGIGPGAFPGLTGNPRQRAQQKQPAEQADQQPQAPQDDPAVHLATPPPANAKLLIQVGWCEVQVFEHTFPNLHLAERLTQLNQKLNFEPGKSGVQLMDHIGAMIKTVQAQKQAARPVSSQTH